MRFEPSNDRFEPSDDLLLAHAPLTYGHPTIMRALSCAIAAESMTGFLISSNMSASDRPFAEVTVRRVLPSTSASASDLALHPQAGQGRAKGEEKWCVLRKLERRDGIAR
jgi:hypothetical protein